MEATLTGADGSGGGTPPRAPIVAPTQPDPEQKKRTEDFLKKVEVIETGFYGLGLSVIVLTDKPVFDISHCWNLILVLAFLAFDGVLKHFLRGQLFRPSEQVFAKRQMTALLSLLAVEVCGLFLYSFWASSFVWGGGQKVFDEHHLYGAYCFLAALYNFVCVCLMKAQEDAGAAHPASGYGVDIKSFFRVIWLLLRSAGSYLFHVLLLDVREWSLLQSSSRLWLEFLRQAEEKAIERINERSTSGSTKGITTNGTDWKRVIRRRFYLHSLMQLSAMHCLLFNLAFALLLFKDKLPSQLTKLPVPYSAELTNLLGSTAALWQFCLVALIVLFFLIVTFGMSARREIERLYEIINKKIVEKSPYERISLFEYGTQALGNIALLLFFISFLIHFNDAPVKLAITFQSTIMIIMAIGSLAQFVPNSACDGNAGK